MNATRRATRSDRYAFEARSGNPADRRGGAKAISFGPATLSLAMRRVALMALATGFRRQAPEPCQSTALAEAVGIGD